MDKTKKSTKSIKAILKKTVSVLLSVAAIGTGIYLARNSITVPTVDETSQTDIQSEQQVKKCTPVYNIEYDQYSKELTWDWQKPVGADSGSNHMFNVYVNDQLLVKTNNFNVDLSKTVVKTGTYNIEIEAKINDYDYSNKQKYVIEYSTYNEHHNQLLDKIKATLGKNGYSESLVGIKCVSLHGGYLYALLINDDNEISLTRFVTNDFKNFDSLELSTGRDVLSSSKATYDYDSLSYLLQGSNAQEDLIAYQNQGYQLTTIRQWSATPEITKTKSSTNIYLLVKATNGEDTKYITCGYSISVDENIKGIEFNLYGVFIQKPVTHVRTIQPAIEIDDDLSQEFMSGLLDQIQLEQDVQAEM